MVHRRSPDVISNWQHIVSDQLMKAPAIARWHHLAQRHAGSRIVLREEVIYCRLCRSDAIMRIQSYFNNFLLATSVAREIVVGELPQSLAMGRLAH